MPDNLLGALGDQPLPPLALAASVRARGRQRQVRTRIGLSAAGAGAAVLFGGVAVALAGGDPEADSLRPAPFAGSRTPFPDARPTAPAPARQWWLPDAFLPAAVAAEAESPGWVAEDPYTPDPVPLGDPCGEQSEPLASKVRDFGEQVMRSRREAGGSSLVQEVYRYDDASAAAASFEEYAQRFRRCAEVPDPDNPPGTTLRSEVLAREEQADSGRLVVRRIPCMEGVCTEHFSTYVLIARAGDAASVVGYTIAEDGDPEREARALAAALERHLRETVLG